VRTREGQGEPGRLLSPHVALTIRKPEISIKIIESFLGRNFWATPIPLLKARRTSGCITPYKQAHRIVDSKDQSGRREVRTAVWMKVVFTPLVTVDERTTPVRLDAAKKHETISTAVNDS